ncbi:MAG: hypothetical protein ACLQKA_01575 [Bryobacteraceae bacterium]
MSGRASAAAPAEYGQGRRAREGRRLTHGRFIEKAAEMLRLNQESPDIGGKTAALANAEKTQLAVLLILLLVYFLQVATPLRLHPDAVKLLAVAESVVHGHGFLFQGRPTQQPPGYPALVALLIQLHLARVWVLVGLNMVFLAIGLVAVRSIFESELSGGLPVFHVCLISLLSFVFIKYSAIPLTDTIFFCVSMLCVAMMNRPHSSGLNLRNVAVSVVLLVASVCLRKIGITLIPALLYTLLFQPRLRLYAARLPLRIKVIGILAAALVAAAVLLATRIATMLFYFKVGLGGSTVTDAARGILNFRLKELGEMAANLPYTACPAIVQHALPFIGALAFLLVLGGIASRRKRFSAVDVYFVSYLAVLLVWPFYDPRFWLPVIPLLIAYCGLSLSRLAQRGIARQILNGYLFLFAAVGLVTLTLNTAVSFSGASFTDIYPEYHATYCAAWHCKEGFDAAKVDQDGLQVLRDYK